MGKEEKNMLQSLKEKYFREFPQRFSTDNA